MKRILVLAIVLLNLLSLTEVSAQNYSSETGKTCTGSGILCDAMNSKADIYTVVIGESEYEFNDYSEYGDFSQEIVTSDGEHYYYNYGDTGSTTENSNVYYYSSDTSTLYSGTSYNSDGGYSGGYSGGYGVTSGYGDDEIIGRGERYWENTNNIYSLYELRFSPLIKTVDYIPNSFIEQKGAEDCTVRAIATAMWLASGDRDDYTLAQSYAKIVAECNRLNLKDFGMYNSQFMSTFGSVFNIKEYCVGEYSHETVQTLIDQNTSVLAILYTDDFYCKGVPYEVTDMELTHMVTIVGYDNNYFYCAYGGKDAVRIPMSAIDEHSIYTCGQLNYEEFKKQQNKNN